MKIVVFGATGVVGHKVVVEAFSALRPDGEQETALLSLSRNVLSAASVAGIPIIVTRGAALLKLADGSGHTVLTAPGFLPDVVRPIAEAGSSQISCLNFTAAMLDVAENRDEYAQQLTVAWTTTPSSICSVTKTYDNV